MSHRMPHTTGDCTKYKADIHLPAVDAYMAQGYGNPGQKCPTVNDFALQIKITKQTLLNWRDKFPAWREKYDELKLFCEEALVQGGLSDTYNANFAKFILSARHEYAEKTIVDNQSSDRSMSPVATIDVTLLDDKTLQAIKSAQIKIGSIDANTD